MSKPRGLTPLQQSSRSIALRFIGLLTGLATQSLVVRGLGPLAYGQFGLLSSNLQIAGQLADVGAEQNSIRVLGAKPQDKYIALRALFTLRLATAVIVVLVVIGIVAIARLPSTMQRASLLAALVVPVSALGASRAVLVAQGESHRVQAGLLVQALVNLAMVAAITFVSQLTLSWAVASLVIATVVNGAMYAWWTHGIGWRNPIDLRGATQLARTSLPLGLAAGCAAIAFRIPTTIILASLGTVAAGFFHAIYRWIDFAQILPQNVMLSLFPGLVNLRLNSSTGRNRYAEMTSGLIASGLWLTVAIAAGGGIAARLMYGPTFDQAAQIAPILGWGLPAVFVSYAHGNTLIAQGRYTTQLRVTVVSLLGTLVYYTVLTRTLGLPGTVIATLLTEYSAACTGAYLVWRTLRLEPPWRRTLAKTALPLALGLGAMALNLGPIVGSAIALAAVAGSALTLRHTLAELPHETVGAAVPADAFASDT